MKIYTVIGGINGAEKSSLTGVLKAERSPLGKIIDVDKLAVEHGGFVDGGKAAIIMQEQFIRDDVSLHRKLPSPGSAHCV